MTKELTEDQKNEAVSLFLVGVHHYTAIAQHLNVPYQSVNTYMTKWKKKHGLLKTRKKRVAKDEIEATLESKLFKVDDQGNKYIGVLTKALFEELEFLRKFYLSHTGKKAA
jgi:transposase